MNSDQTINTISSRQKRGAFFAAFGGICWGFSGTCGQFLFQHCSLDTRFLTSVRMISAGILLILMGFITRPQAMKGLLHSRKDVFHLVLFAILGLLVSQYTYLTAISYSNAGTATVLQYLGPVLIMVFLCLTKKKLPTFREACALILAVGGTFLLATHGRPGTLAISPQALFWGLSSAVGLVLYSMLPIRLIEKWGSLPVTGCAMLIGGLFFGLITRAWAIPVTIDGPALFGMAGVILVGTVLAYTLYLQGVADAGPAHASLLASTEPVAATVFSAALLHSVFHPADLLGFAAIILAVILLSLPERQS